MHSTIKLLAFCATCIFCCHAGDSCPSKDKLSPCTCSQNSRLVDAATVFGAADLQNRGRRDVHANLTTNGTSHYTVVKCESLKSVGDLQETVSKALHRRWIDKLLISNITSEHGHLTRLPHDWLDFIRIRQLEIKNMQLIEDFIWNRQPLRNQTESLYWLKVSNCSLSGLLTRNTLGTVQTNGLNLFRRLQGIDFSYNHLTAIDDSAFRYSPANLTTLILANNKIQHVDDGSFQKIRELAHIDLSHNLISTISRSVFATPAKHLKHIDVSWNNIQYLPTDFFVNMSALVSVDFSYNFLYSFPADPWASVWKQLSFINVAGNFIECDCGLRWMLPILQFRNSNQTDPGHLPGRTVMGQCVQSLNTGSFETAIHDLTSLKRNLLTCNELI